MRRAGVLLLLLLGGCAIGASAGARNDSPPQRGRLIAERRCAGCHDVNRNGASLFWRAPRFRNMRNSPEDIRRFAADISSHTPDGMPRISLTSEEAADLYAYMRSLRKPDPEAPLADVPLCPRQGC